MVGQPERFPAQLADGCSGQGKMLEERGRLCPTVGHCTTGYIKKSNLAKKLSSVDQDNKIYLFIYFSSYLLIFCPYY